MSHAKVSRAPPPHGDRARAKDEAKEWEKVMDKEAAAKSFADQLMECNMKYQRLMRELRESQEFV